MSTRDERDQALVDRLLHAQARSPAPALAPAVFARLGARRTERSPLWRPLAMAGTFGALLLAVGVGLGLRLAPTSSSPDQSSSLRTVHFTLTAPGASTVALVGDFNGWAASEGLRLLPTGADRFVASVDLPAGRYAYAFVVDGEQVVSDPRALTFEPDGFGGTNSVLEL